MKRASGAEREPPQKCKNDQLRNKVMFIEKVAHLEGVGNGLNHGKELTWVQPRSTEDIIYTHSWFSIYSATLQASETACNFHYRQIIQETTGS